MPRQLLNINIKWVVKVGNLLISPHMFGIKLLLFINKSYQPLVQSFIIFFSLSFFGLSFKDFFFWLIHSFMFVF